MSGGLQIPFKFIYRLSFNRAILAIALLVLPAAAETEPVEIADGNKALEAKDYNRAWTAFDQVLQKDPDNVAAHVGRGRAYAGRADSEHALADYNEALRLDPKSKNALWNRHFFYFSRKELKEALADIDALIAIEPDSANNFQARARDKWFLKDYEGALSDIERSVGLSKDDPEFIETRARILCDAGALVEAIDDHTQAIRLNGKNYQYYLYRGQAYELSGRYADALDDYREAVQIGSGKAASWNGYAWLLATCADARFLDAAKAVEAATKACELTRWNEYSYIDTLAAAYARANDFENAVRWQKKAIENDKSEEDSQEMRDRLAMYERKEVYAEKSCDPEKTAWAQLRSECFETVWRTVNDNYFDPTFGGVDWRGVRAKYRLKIWMAENKQSLRKLLQEMLDELHRTHFCIVPREMAVLCPEERGRIGYTGAEVSVIEDAVTVTRVKPGSPAEKAGVKPGDVVTRVGKNTLREIAAMINEAGITPRKRLQYLCSYVGFWLVAPVGAEVSLQLAGVAGGEREVKIVSVAYEGIWSDAMGFAPSEPVEIETIRNPQGVVYLRFNQFALPAMNEFKRCVHSLREGDALIVDLRGNPGGLTLMAPGIFGRLSAKEVSLGTMHQRYDTEEFTAYPQHGAFLGPVAVLVDSRSASTSEILAAGLQELGRARIFGENTAGAALPSLFRKLPTGDMLQYAVADIKTPHGVLIEGNGVVPDEPVKVLRADCAAGRDPVREAAERWLLKQRQAKAREVAKK